MSDSGETDILLLIPPDFFNCESPALVTPRAPKATTNCSLGSVDHLSYESFIDCNGTASMAGIENCSMAHCSAANRTEQYVASTPFKRHNHRDSHKERYLLNEIDQYLQESDHRHAQESEKQQHEHQHNGIRSPHDSLVDINGLSMNEYSSLSGNDFGNLLKPIPSGGPVPQKPPRNVQSSLLVKPYSKNGNMLNLSDIWPTQGSAMPDYQKALQEERLRRQHCERNIQSLQMKLLEYEEKMSVALTVDKEKVSVIGKLELEVARLTNRIRDMERSHIDTHEKLMNENVEVRNKNLLLEKELTSTVNLSRNLQEQKDILELKVDNLASANRDVNEVHRKQQEDLQVRLANSRDSERQLKEQLGKQRKVNEELNNELQEEKRKVAEGAGLREDVRTMKRKSEMLAKQLADALRENVGLQEQTGHMKQQISVHQEESKNLLKELEIQRISLKKYYQSQLEDVVTDKLNEFQKQLTTVEEELKAEASKKERALADRAKRQIELIDQKREQEVLLLTERYNEQESLYRLQLANSAKRIHELEDKLRTIQNRRADIASQLHLIMETQWKQALDVLMSPGQHSEERYSSKLSDLEAKSQYFQRLSVGQLDKDRLDGVLSLKQAIVSDDVNNFQTPVQASHREPTNGPPSGFPKELLHNYIELLLEKSPNDLKRLEEVLSSCRKQSEKESCTEMHGADGTGNVSRSASATALNQLGKKPCPKGAPRPWK